jgi:hypothetical protein
MRQITIYSTKYGIKKIDSDATTWGELKNEIIETGGYDLTNLTATENVNKTTLESMEAVLPEGDFVLFLRATKFKAGADYANMSFADLRSHLTDELKELIKERYNRNWTQLSKKKLAEFLMEIDKLDTSDIFEGDAKGVPTDFNLRPYALDANENFADFLKTLLEMYEDNWEFNVRDANHTIRAIDNHTDEYVIRITTHEDLTHIGDDDNDDYDDEDDSSEDNEEANRLKKAFEDFMNTID